MTTATISPDSVMSDVLRAYPSAQRALMRRYHIGGCSNCGFRPEERLGDVLQRHNVLNAEEVIEHIHASHEQERQIQIGPRELKALLGTPAAPRLLDVRSPQEQDIVKLEGAVPASQALVQEMMQTWPTDTPIVCYCHHGIRSLEAASYLIGHGFTNVRSLSGGIDAWAEEVEPAMPRY